MIIEEKMGQPDPINDILKKAREDSEKGFLMAYKKDDIDDALQYLRCYRMFTKLLNRETLDIFDFWEGKCLAAKQRRN